MFLLWKLKKVLWKVLESISDILRLFRKLFLLFIIFNHDNVFFCNWHIYKWQWWCKNARLFAYSKIPEIHVFSSIFRHFETVLVIFFVHNYIYSWSPNYFIQESNQRFLKKRFWKNAFFRTFSVILRLFQEFSKFTCGHNISHRSIPYKKHVLKASFSIKKKSLVWTFYCFFSNILCPFEPVPGIFTVHIYIYS